jgi:hypothetical protein
VNTYGIEIFEHVTGFEQPKLRETHNIEAIDITVAIVVAKNKCREINSPALTTLSGHIHLSGFRIRDGSDSIVYNSTPQDMSELAS